VTLDLDQLAHERGASQGALARQHALEGLLRRLAAAAHRDRWVLRGSALTRWYCAPWPREVADLDVLDLDDHDPGRTEERFRAVATAALEDGCRYLAEEVRSEPLWAESTSPGLRFVLPVSEPQGCAPVQFDVAFHDPVAPPPVLLEGPTLLGPITLQVCRRETLIAWKVHGLFEKGLGTFRPKDLLDIALLSRGVELDADALRQALQVAFESRGASIRLAERLARGALGQSRWSLEKWRRFAAGSPHIVPPLPEVVTEVAGRLGPTLLALIEAEAP
jgi:hypothetical protein